MTELLPTREAADLVSGITDYLKTTFALSDHDAQEALGRFLVDPDHGMFRGPYVRLRLPFEPAQEDWSSALDVYPASFPPYGHQAAAFQRLTTKTETGEGFRRPEPTLVTTGTGSGKTESFLYPILDHVVRARAAGIHGVKALILYPMNALANDQAERLKNLILEEPEFADIRAALYTGEVSGSRTQVSERGLINDRNAIRTNPPDILLTNYKMLDMLLLRSEDARLWERSAKSLTYVVLDEFHTYDGAQGTDVAMLLRRLGLALKSYWPAELPRDLEEAQRLGGPIEADRDNPLGMLTPVATSATLGGSGGSEDMLGFAQTVFGIPFEDDALVTETRKSFDEWEGSDREAGKPRRLEDLTRLIPETVEKTWSAHPDKVLEIMAEALFEEAPGLGKENAPALIDALKAHPLTRELAEGSTDAVPLRELAGRIFPRADIELAEEFLANAIALYSHARALGGREALTVETHLWVRELSRIDSRVGLSHTYRWGDDGPLEVAGDDEGETLYLPAIYCRHCGKSGWSVKLWEDGMTVETKQTDIRTAALNHSARFVPLLHAAKEDQVAARKERTYEEMREGGLRYFHIQHRSFVGSEPDREQADYKNGLIVPVLTLMGSGDGKRREEQTCPACLTPDAIRFVGSAVSTLTSVAISNIFGAADLDPAEKKALVFTDSVQDAAHRAGFIQARSHTFNLRSALRDGFGDDGSLTLSQLIEQTLRNAVNGGPAERFKLVPPELIEHAIFRAFWAPKDDTQEAQARRAMKARLEFDGAMEFGLQARLGRTLELTGSVVAEVDAGSSKRLATIGRKVWDNCSQQIPGLAEPTDRELAAWIRGVLVRIRLQGGINHPWLKRYQESGGLRYHVWGGRPKSKGMPAFPKGRPAPAFPTTAPAAEDDRTSFVQINAPQSWYTHWTSRNLEVNRRDASHLITNLFEALDEEGIISSLGRPSGAVYAIEPEQILLSVPTDEELENKRCTLICSICQTTTFGTARVIDELEGAPCLQNRCEGQLERTRFEPNNYYRGLYESKVAKRVVAREHTSLLPSKLRLEYEKEFKSSDQAPDAPNVLVATPTLEMGIDIGDLSCVMLASLPRSVANYVQRVGRAGRLTGNSLILAFVRGRGINLPRISDPLGTINGEVVPPSTYLSAEEILRRQYCAYLADTVARDGSAPHPTRVSQVMASEGDSPYLTELMDRRADHLDEFLAQFGTFIDEEQKRALRTWAIEQLPGTVLAIRDRWSQDLKEIRGRIEEVHVALEEYEQDIRKAEDIAINKDRDPAVLAARSLYRSALAQDKRLRAEFGAMNGEYWISALESYGLFPNYTLLDDQVTLGVGISWINEENGRFDGDSQEFVRGAATAIHELAPGATFYANGMAIRVDAVDLGPNRRELQYWHICPGCGWIDELTNAQPRVHTCPRCGEEEINDTSQVLPVARLTRVSAEVRRGENTIGDGEDERRQTNFEVVAMADLDRADAETAWSVKGLGVAVEYYRYATVSWLNLNQRESGATKMTIAGEEYGRPLFTVCEYCGQLDYRLKDNRGEDHRPWCRFRKSDKKHNIKLGLARRLRTQGACLHLAHSLVDRSGGSVASLKAALLLGLQESLGGTPGHLSLLQVPSDIPGHTGIFIHDTVPGGTGYLATFKNPKQIFNALKAALDKVANCECKYEDRQSCHRCLLPYADHGKADQVARVTAESLLRSILGIEPGEETEPTFDSWEVIDEIDRAGDSVESPLEYCFRQALAKRLEEDPAIQVVRKPGTWGDTLQFQFPNSPLHWKLEPQIHLGGTRPDFLLSCTDATIPRMAIYTDGRFYHASTRHNRVGDDAQKRAALRTQGYIPWAITKADVDRFERQELSVDAGKLLQIRQDIMARLVDEYNLNRGYLRALRGGAMELLWQWMQDPNQEAWQQLACVAPALTITDLAQVKTGPVEETETGIAEQTLSEFLGLEENSRWWKISDDVAFIAAEGVPTSIDTLRGPRMIVALNDSDASLVEEGFEIAWRRWLLWSNVASLHPEPDRVLVTTTSATADILGLMPTSIADGGDYGAWTHAIFDALGDELEPDEEEFFQALSSAGVPVAVLGEEIEGISVLALWEDAKLAVVYDEDEAGPLKSAGYETMTMDEVDTIINRLGKEN